MAPLMASVRCLQGFIGFDHKGSSIVLKGFKMQGSIHASSFLGLRVLPAGLRGLGLGTFAAHTFAV